MTLRCTEPRFGLVGLFMADSLEDFMASIADSIDGLARSVTGIAHSHAEAHRMLEVVARVSPLSVDRTVLFRLPCDDGATYPAW